MLTLSEAFARIFQNVQPGPVEKRALLDACGLPLAEDVSSTTDSPPFDKSMMDGFAIRCSDLGATETSLNITATITAGDRPGTSVGKGEAVRIMTGAPIPSGADAVVRIEDTESSERRVLIRLGAVAPGQFIIRRGSSMRCGERLLSRGSRLTPGELGLLAEIGQGEVQIYRPPTVAIIATGNELVPIDSQPGPGQIRNSNEIMLTGQIRRAGGTPVPLGIAGDTHEALTERVKRGLESDFLCLSGGVSAGVLDLVPQVLQELGVREVFHKVDIKPGKPVWFGIREGEQRRQYVFGLPGNPVSSMVCFEVFVRMSIQNWLGQKQPEPLWQMATWKSKFEYSTDRTTLFPCRLELTANGLQVQSSEWKGSFDLRGIAGCSALAFIPRGDHRYDDGDAVQVLPLDSIFHS